MSDKTVNSKTTCASDAETCNQCNEIDGDINYTKYKIDNYFDIKKGEILKKVIKLKENKENIDNNKSNNTNLYSSNTINDESILQNLNSLNISINNKYQNTFKFAGKEKIIKIGYLNKQSKFLKLWRK